MLAIGAPVPPCEQQLHPVAGGSASAVTTTYGQRRSRRLRRGLPSPPKSRRRANTGPAFQASPTVHGAKAGRTVRQAAFLVLHASRGAHFRLPCTVHAATFRRRNVSSSASRVPPNGMRIHSGAP